MVSTLGGALEVKGACKSYRGVQALRGVDLQADAGTVLGLIGPNGAGKSTLIGGICGDVRLDSGRVRIFGADVTHKGSWQRARLGLGRTFQVARLFGRQTVWECMAVSALGRGSGIGRWLRSGPSQAEDVRTRAVEALGEVSIDERMLDVPVATLSLGERKRLELAMALFQPVGVLLLDEPTAGMGRNDSEAFRKLIHGLRRDRADVTIVLTSHDVDLLFGLADQVALLVDGRVAVVGPAEQVRSDPSTVASFLGSEG